MERMGDTLGVAGTDALGSEGGAGSAGSGGDSGPLGAVCEAMAGAAGVGGSDDLPAKRQAPTTTTTELTTAPNLTKAGRLRLGRWSRTVSPGP